MSWFSWGAARKIKSPESKEAEECFTAAELKELQKTFQDVCTLQASGKPASRDDLRRGLDVAHLGSLVGAPWRCLDPLLQSRLMGLMADKADGRVHCEGFILARARLERLGEEASLEFIFRLMDVGSSGLSYGALEAAVTSCLRLAGALLSLPLATPSATTIASATIPDPIQQCIAAVCRGALAFAASDAAAADIDWKAVRMSYDKYCQWTKRCPAVHRTLSGLLLRGVGVSREGGGAVVLGQQQQHQQKQQQQGVGGGGGGFEAGRHPPGAAAGWELPSLVQLGKLASSATLLQPVWVWALSSRLPPAQRRQWRLLFSSQRDGKSFNTFFGRVSAAACPSLLLLRDDKGAVFGGYASQPWAKSGTFFGDVSCFLFSLLPTLQVYPATGINDNYQWCGVGFSQLPGGLGFGGAALTAGGGAGGGPGGGPGSGGSGFSHRGHFALYVQPSLDSGMTRPIATYGNVPLASEQVFQIDTVECWGLQPPEEEDEGNPSSSGSFYHKAKGAASGGSAGVLSKAEDRAFMQLAGMNLHSEGLKDEPLEET